MRFAYTLAAFTLAPALWPQAADLPKFEQFKVADVYKGKPAAPVLRTARDREFRTRIREGAAKGPNFAGHYTIADWGCGAGCVSIALIDAVDGHIYAPPFDVLAWQLMKYEGHIVSNGDKFEPLEFDLRSRLLIARGCFNEEECASFFYEWTGTQFKLLRKIPGVAMPQ